MCLVLWGEGGGLASDVQQPNNTGAPPIVAFCCCCWRLVVWVSGRMECAFFVLFCESVCPRGVVSEGHITDQQQQHNVEMAVGLHNEVRSVWIGTLFWEGTFFLWVGESEGEERGDGKGTKHCGTVGNTCKSSLY